MGTSTQKASAGRELFQSLEVYLIRYGYEAIMSEPAATPPASGSEADTTGD